MRRPKIRQASATKSPYPLNRFPASFAKKVAQRVFAVKATSLFAESEVDISGSLWETIFAESIGAKRKKALANGIDDIQHPKISTAWSAKTVKWIRKANIVELIKDPTVNGNAKIDLVIGRTSPVYSYGITVDNKKDTPEEVAALVLGIWNERVKSVRAEYSTLRTVVMVKCPMLERVVIFEKDTILYDHKNYEWQWNSRGNLEGKADDLIEFTWQPHGSQLTKRNVFIPTEALVIDIAQPIKLSLGQIIESGGWNDDCFMLAEYGYVVVIDKEEAEKLGATQEKTVAIQEGLDSRFDSEKDNS